MSVEKTGFRVGDGLRQALGTVKRKKIDASSGNLSITPSEIQNVKTAWERDLRLSSAEGIAREVGAEAVEVELSGKGGKVKAELLKRSDGLFFAKVGIEYYLVFSTPESSAFPVSRGTEFPAPTEVTARIESILAK